MPIQFTKNFSKKYLKQLADKLKKAQEVGLKSLEAGENQASREILALLKELNQGIKRTILQIDADTFKAYHLERLNKAIDDYLTDFKKKASRITIGHVGDAIETARALNVTKFNLIKGADGILDIPPIVSNELLSVLPTISTELIRGLSDEVSKKVKGAIQRGVLGAKTPFEVAKEIAPIIGNRDIGASYAADRIVRTEVNRAASMVDQLFIKANLDSRPEGSARLIKIWLTAGDDRVRSTHKELDKLWVYAEDDFKVGIESGGSESMNGPRDTKASAGNVINCRCALQVVPEYLAEDFQAKPQE